MNTSFPGIHLLKRYPDKSLRIVTYKELKEGDEIEFQNENWTTESGVVSEIKENRPSLGTFTGRRPTSYRLILL